MNRRVVIALSALLVLCVAGFYNGRVAGEESASPEIITYEPVDADAEVGTEQHPFTILEIVPDKSQATMGYLIPGCEPVENLTQNVTAMEAYKLAFCGDASDSIATVDDGAKCVFLADFPTDLGYDASDENRVSNEDDTYLHFGQYGYFEHVAEGLGTYKYVAPTEDRQGYFAPIVPGDDGNQAMYRWVPLMNYEQTEGNVAPFEGATTHYLTGDKYTDTECAVTEEYYAFMEGGSEKPFYGIPLVDDIEAERPEQNQEKVLTEEAIGGESDLEGSRFYQDRYEQNYYVYYNQTISHKDSLVQSLFPGKSTHEGFRSQVITVTSEQLRGTNVTGEESNIIRDADMIVIHDSTVSRSVNETASALAEGENSYTFADANDLNEDCYNALIAREASGKPAIMWLDASGLDACVTGRDGNAEKLYSVLKKYGAKYFYNVYCNGPTWEREKIPDGDTFNHGTCGGGAALCKNPFVLSFDNDTMLCRAITDESVKNLVSTLYEKANPNVNLTGAMATSRAKTKLHILELQPIAQFIYGETGWRSYYMELLPDDFVGTSEDLAEDIQVTTMATYEFNGKIEDLNSVYDMVLIGGSQDDTNGLNGYNDTSMGNLAYTTVGDLVSTDDGTVYFDDYERFRDVCGFTFSDRFVDDDKHWINGIINAWNLDLSYGASFIGSNKGSDISQCNIRYNGTDVTEKRYEELIDFSLKNPIVIDGKLYKDSGEVDDAFVDCSSFIYSLAKISTIASGGKQNFIEPYAKVREGTVANYSDRVLGYSCEMVFSAETEEPNQSQGENGKPVEYSYEEADGDKKTIDRGTITNNNQIDENNNNVLRYHFTLYGKEDAKYKVTLGIDSNGNGSFEEEEWKENLYILDTTPGGLEQQVIDQSKGETLQAGHTYTVTRTLPATEVGMLPWKLQVYDVDAASLRDSDTGYTRIANGQKTTIQVLQMNLTPEDDMNQNMNTNINFADSSSSVGSRFREYLDGVDDYDIQVTFLKNKDFYNLYGKDSKVKAWTDYLMSYDMLILGFGDMASFSDNEVFLEGFKTFVDAGKSVILSHDMVYDKSFAYPVAGFDFDWGWQFSENRYAAWDVNVKTSAYLRELSGQVKKYFSVDPVTSQPVGSYTDTYSQGQKLSTLPKSDLEVAYLYRWRYAVSWQGTGYWEFQPDANYYCWMDQTDYRYRLPGVREYTCNLMDNSIRTMIFASRVKPSDKLDRVITNPSKNNASVTKSSLAWPTSCITTTVKVANQGQITSYPFAMDDTITVGQTHAQNYRLDLERGELSGFDSHFNINGEYLEWDDVPMTDGSWWTEATDKNRGTIVYDRGVAYGYAEANEEGSSSRNGGALTSMMVTIEQEDGVSQDFQIQYIAVADDGTIDLNPQTEGLAPGDYKFYLASTGFSSENINNLKKNPNWNDDMIFGEMTMHITDGQDKAEYRLDIDAMTSWNRQSPMDVTKVKNVKSCLYGLSSTEGTPPSYQSKDTDDYVISLGTKTTDGAIVWYNLSNSNSDSTNIYSAKDGDSANNYYIYTRDNITYTGLGHSGDMTDDEIRLFINTMISAYRSIPAAPYVTVANSDVINNGDISTLYVEERGDQTDKAVMLKVNDDSTTTLQRTYRMKITLGGQPVEQLLEGGQPVRKNSDGTFTVKEDGLYTLVAPYGDGDTSGTIAGEGMLEYKVELTTSYADENKQNSVSDRVVRVMTMPLFELD